MIYSLTGNLVSKKDNFVVLDVNGVGYKVFVSGREKLVPVGSETTLFTFFRSREDGIDLYGFRDEKELAFFELLLSVSGVGPKSALNIISLATVPRLISAIKSGEADLLQKSSGIGRKTSERLIVELRDKLKNETGADLSNSQLESDNDIYEAMVGMGYTRDQVKTAILKIDPKLEKLDDRLRDALKKAK